MKKIILENICSVVEYETYLSDKYEFCPLNSNTDRIWEESLTRRAEGNIRCGTKSL